MRIAILAGILAVATASASAQDTSERPEGIICQPPQCDIMRSLTDSLEVPLQAESAVVHLVRNVLASALDPALPPVAVDQWLMSTLYPHIEIPRENIVDWSLIYCSDPRSAIPRAGPDLCVEASAPLSATKTVKVMIGVAEGQTTIDGRKGWVQHAPSVRDIYIERLGDLSIVDSLDVPTLGTLEKQIQLPVEKWPVVDLKSAITWTPEKWMPGDVVHFTIWVENVGTRDAERAEVHVLIAPSPVHEDNFFEIRRDWFPHVPAGRRVGFGISVRLPRGDAIAHVSAVPREGLRRMREMNHSDSETTVVIGIDLVGR